MSDATRIHLDHFWKLLDEILNSILFVLIGIEVLIISYNFDLVLLALGIVAIVLLARFLSILIPVTAMKYFRDFSPHIVKLMTWGGLRGGISVALALSLPSSPYRDFLISMTYAVVVFSVLIQGSTFSLALRKLKI